VEARAATPQPTGFGDRLVPAQHGRLSRTAELKTTAGEPAVGEGGDRIYLNFAKDWRSDFTISVEREDGAAFTAAGIDLKDLTGRRVRVRGWLEWRNGPMIEATHAEQLEILPDARAPGETKPAPQSPVSVPL
jgi:hypothetical protein